jgi:hypothetical protein
MRWGSEMRSAEREGERERERYVVAARWDKELRWQMGRGWAWRRGGKREVERIFA